MLNRIKLQRGVPKLLYRNKGSEFSSHAFVKSFTGTFWAKCPDAHWFTSLTEAQQILEIWRAGYHESRPDKALGERTLNKFALRSYKKAGPINV